MAVNPLIALQTKGLDTATPTRNLVDMKVQSEQLDMQRQQNKRQERMADLQEQQVSAEVLQQNFERLQDQEKRRVKNTAVASGQLQRVLESQGEDAALAWLQNNAESNSRFNLPSDETNEAMELLRSGRADQLRTNLSNNVYVAEKMGWLSSDSQNEQYVPVYDDAGNILGQRNTSTGKVVSDPRAPDSSQAWDGMSASDSNSIQSQAASLYGGIYDPQTGEFRGLDKDGAQNALAIAERAAQIYRENQGQLGHAEATTRAAREFGIDVSNIQGQNRNRQAADQVADEVINGRQQQPGPTRERAEQQSGAQTRPAPDRPKIIRYDEQGNRIE